MSEEEEEVEEEEDGKGVFGNWGVPCLGFGLRVIPVLAPSDWTTHFIPQHGEHCADFSPMVLRHLPRLGFTCNIPTWANMEHEMESRVM